MHKPVTVDLRLMEHASAQELCGGNQEMEKVRTLLGVSCRSRTQVVRLSAYAYILTPNNLCKRQGVLCNEDFGISLGRGAFRLQPGQ